MARTASTFFDESGQDKHPETSLKWYLLTMVLHNQDDDVSRHISSYEKYINRKGLPDIPFHMVELMHGHGGYQGVSLENRKQLLMSFNSFVQHLPIRYHTFVYRRSEFDSYLDLSERMRRDLCTLIDDNLSEFQSYITIGIYYDGGQSAVNRAIHSAFDEKLSANTAEYKKLRYQEKRLAQVADYLCSVELAALRYDEGRTSETYKKIYGGRRNFRANYLKQARRKLI